MSLFKRHATITGPTAADLIGARTSRRRGIAKIPTETALRHSAVWACRRLRADLVSTMPVDVFRKVNGIRVEVPKGPIFRTPGGDTVDWCEWVYSSQTDLDTVGNTVGIITQRGGDNLPSRIELVPFESVTVRGKGSTVTEYVIGGTTYRPDQVWHEKQYTAPGLAIGLSPIAYAAITIGGYLTAQEFALDWFAGGGIPSARLKNTARKIDHDEASKVKDRFRETVGNGDVFVYGSDWEYDTIQAKASETAFLDQMQAGLVDVCRFMGVPADMIDAPVGGGSITYANITQRNLQLLIMNLDPAITRRENAWTRKFVAQPRYVKLKRDSLLAMDALTRSQVTKSRIDSRTLAPSEARALEDLPPFTPEQVAEFGVLFPSRAPAPMPAPSTNPEGS